MFHQWNPNPNPSYFPPQPYIVSPNPSSSFAPPVFPSAVAAAATDPALHPPGTEIYSNSALVPSTYAGLEGQPQFYADPVAASHNWGVPQADAVGFALNSTIENPVASTSSNSLLNGNWATPSLGHNATRGTHVKTKFTQPVRCEVCKIDCNSKDVFDAHVLGKKHKKNLESLNSSLMGTAFGNINVFNQIGNAGQLVQGTPDVSAASKNLKANKRKLVDTGVKAESARVCSVCNVVCNSEDVFDKHLSGKKHKAQAFLASQNPFVAAIRSQYDSSLKMKPKKNKIIQYVWCEVCKISCNSNEIYAKHLTGKKHLKNMENIEKGKSGGASTSNVLPSATYPIIGPMENPAANNPSSDDVQKMRTSSAETPEDLETKKRKIVESGTAAVCVRTCTICNVVCNSQTVFDFHLAGQKHVAMMKKQAMSGMSMLVPPLFTAFPN